MVITEVGRIVRIGSAIMVNLMRIFHLVCVVLSNHEEETAKSGGTDVDAVLLKK